MYKLEIQHKCWHLTLIVFDFDFVSSCTATFTNFYSTQLHEFLNATDYNLVIWQLVIYLFSSWLTYSGQYKYVHKLECTWPSCCANRVLYCLILLQLISCVRSHFYCNVRREGREWLRQAELWEQRVRKEDKKSDSTVLIVFCKSHISIILFFLICVVWFCLLLKNVG